MTASARIAILGSPSHPDVEWSAENLESLRTLGFTAVQLNIAWSYRPLDEPLNLEDVWPVPGPVESRARPGNLETRQVELARRASLARAAGLRTLFHFGAPFQGRSGFEGSALPQCISDPATAQRYVGAISGFGREFADIDDLLIYTYDQDAWLCSEFGGCDRCFGVPLHDRLPVFLNAIAAAWTEVRPGGRTWWEPWELSAGQTLACLPRLDSSTMGVMLHSSIAEVISTVPGDRFFRNAVAVAASHGIPAIAEVFLSSGNEEVEPWGHLPVPLVTVRQLRELERIPGVVGVKEYFGIVPSSFDVNLRAAAAYFREPDATDAAVLDEVAVAFGASWLPQFWTAASRAYELYPWDATWFARQMARSLVAHELTAATVRGMQSNASEWDTPAWRSSRGSIFMRTTNAEPHPWLLEDVGLRFAESAAAMEGALAVFAANFMDDGSAAAVAMRLQQSEAIGFVTRATAFRCHLRESSLAALLRVGSPRRDLLLAELRALLLADLDNQRRELGRRSDPSHTDSAAIAPSALQLAERWVVADRHDTTAIETAIAVLDRDVDDFLATYFLVAPDEASAGQFSLTSR